MTAQHGSSTSRPDEARDVWAERRARVASEIELAALDLFAEHGIDKVSIEQIAAAAGISMRTFFRYFPSRDNLMLALPQRHVEQLCAATLRRPADEPVMQAFINAVRELGERPEEERLRLWGRALQRGPMPQHDHMRPTSGMIAAYADVIAKRAGLAPDDLRVEVIATAIGGVMWSSFLRWMESSGERPLADLIQESFTILTSLDLHAG